MGESIKLAVTVRSALAGKYTPDALKKIDTAIDAWIAAENVRGIKTVLVGLDTEKDMRSQGQPPIQGKVTALKAKKAIDALAKKLAPDYVVILGGDDVVPHFQLPNPSESSDDPDRTVPSDNPYATSRPFVAGSSKSYLVPDRVVGRIPDLPAAKGKGDPATLLAALKTATNWKPQPRSFYSSVYATCTETWETAGIEVMKHLQFPPRDLMISPPAVDTKASVRTRLARTVHMTKCHGADPYSKFFGEGAHSNEDFEVLFSGTLAGRVKPGTLAAAVCCYGAQVYAPDGAMARQVNPPGSLPVPVEYLHAGALCFMGSTKIAWVGHQTMMCADVIVADFLKKALDGASIGRALLEAKQDYMAMLQSQGATPEIQDEKTLIEFVLLGDPAIHPIASTVPAAVRSGPVAAARRAALRSDRRVARAAVADRVEKGLPTRTAMAAPQAKTAEDIFKQATSLLQNGDLKRIDPAHATASCVVAPVAGHGLAVAARRGAAATGARETMQYTWTARLPQKGKRADEAGGPVRLIALSVQTDPQGRVLRSRTLYSA